MTTRCANVLRTLCAALAIVDDKLDPSEQDVVYRAVLDHVRARRPESVGYLSQLPPPESPIRDPRDGDAPSVTGDTASSRSYAPLAVGAARRAWATVLRFLRRAPIIEAKRFAVEMRREIAELFPEGG